MQNLYCSIMFFMTNISFLFFNFYFKSHSDKTLGYLPKVSFCVFLKDDGQVEGDFFSQEFLGDENDSSEEGSDAVNSSETTQDNVSTWKSKHEFLRQRKQTYQVKDSVLFILSTIKNSS